MKSYKKNKFLEGGVDSPIDTQEYVFNQTMLRIKNPEVSIPFYTDVLGMTLFRKLDFPKMSFSLYFLGFHRPGEDPIPKNVLARTEYTFRRNALLELTHNWGTERDKSFYHNGNSDPRGFGHIGVSVPNVYAACERFEELGVKFIKRPDDGKMKGLAFISDPDGYWIEILEARSLARLTEI